jgi:glutathionylspermidine synthase
MSSPWSTSVTLTPADYRQLRQRAIFECSKWDQQVGDVATLAPFALILAPTVWSQLADWAEKLSDEILAVEKELEERHDLWPALGLPRALLKLPPGLFSASAARLIRFDFHWTTQGWKISEANTDVPGGLNEASGYPTLFQPFVSSAAPIGHTVQIYASALQERCPTGGRIALIHATAYSDDRQVMVYVAEELKRKGYDCHLAAPDHLLWRDGKAWLHLGSILQPLDLVIRFYPGEWLPNLDRACGWKHFFQGSATPLSNPASALFIQSKRLPLLWNQLKTPVPTWRKLLPMCAEPSSVPWAQAQKWVIKPVWGRVGEGIGLAEYIPEADWKKIKKAVQIRPEAWIAQERFESLPLTHDGENYHPCLGVYTVNSKAAGIYGRIAKRPLINYQAQDIAVFQATSSVS